EHRVSVSASSFDTQQQLVMVVSGAVEELHFQLAPATVEQSVEVTGTSELVNPGSSTPETLIRRADISETPGADRSNSLSMITNFVLGSYMVHDQLHVRGGHQV